MDKEKSNEKIDGISALTMATDRVIRNPEGDAGATAYDDDGIFSV